MELNYFEQVKYRGLVSMLILKIITWGFKPPHTSIPDSGLTFQVCQ